eukprot:CAMPEP_0169474712 /NCGR_PEP_ID=MMETSP1042-20121227/26406_1 /TAXON_ID=464988 /ORGANISM="Hemiselmis andersenii, Strain CCMP1180" /LENGTH=74 /DNA_ID=CAMNT_0009588767 /DNA_START=24 /DNA_END=244 /DNA_ORIENTATION=+
MSARRACLVFAMSCTPSVALSRRCTGPGRQGFTSVPWPSAGATKYGTATDMELKLSGPDAVEGGCEFTPGGLWT